MNTETSEKSTPELLDAIGSKIKSMTVDQISNETGKTVRAIRTHLTRHGISVKDYDGAGKKAKTKIVPEAKPESSIATTTPQTYTALSEIRKDSDNRWQAMAIVFGVGWVAMTWWGFATFGGGFFLFWIALSVGILTTYGFTSSSMDDAAEKKKLGAMTSVERDSYVAVTSSIRERQSKIMANYHQSTQFGDVNPNLVCPHCQTKGKVRSKASEEITSTKVVPVVGNTIKARKKVTQMHCDNCGTTWNV